MISLLCKHVQSLLARVLREESGSAAVNVVFFLIGGIALTAFVVDATRVSADGRASSRRPMRLHRPWRWKRRRTPRRMCWGWLSAM